MAHELDLVTGNTGESNTSCLYKYFRRAGASHLDQNCFDKKVKRKFKGNMKFMYRYKFEINFYQITKLKETTINNHLNFILKDQNGNDPNIPGIS